MQYILTEQEYNDLVGAIEKHKEDTENTIEGLCHKVCDNIKIDGGEPYGCIHTTGQVVCDDCPVQDVCPSHRSYSD